MTAAAITPGDAPDPATGGAVPKPPTGSELRTAEQVAPLHQLVPKWQELVAMQGFTTAPAGGVNSCVRFTIMIPLKSGIVPS